MKKILGWGTGLALFMAVTVFAEEADPYDWNSYMDRVRSHEIISLSKKNIGTVIEEGTWESLVFYVGTDGFQAVSLYQDEYERKLGMSFQNAYFKTIYLTTDYLENPGEYMCVYNMVPEGVIFSTYVRFYQNEHQLEDITVELE